MYTSAAIMVTAVISGPGKAVRATLPLPVVNMWSSLPQTIDGDLRNEDGGLFSNIVLFFYELGGEDVTLFFLIFLDDVLVHCSGGSFYTELCLVELYTMLRVGYSHALSLENELGPF